MVHGYWINANVNILCLIEFDDEIIEEYGY